MYSAKIVDMLFQEDKSGRIRRKRLPGDMGSCGAGDHAPAFDLHSDRYPLYIPELSYGKFCREAEP